MMWLILTWTCFWLSLIGDVSSLSCYQCEGEKGCKDEKKPFETVNCTFPPPFSTCFILMGKYGQSVQGRERVWFRGCAHPEWIQEFGGAVDYCKINDEGWKVSNAATNWVKNNPPKHAGGTQTFIAESALDWEICTCTGTDLCNEDMGKAGKRYPVPSNSNNNNNGNNNCVCDNNQDQC